MGKSPDKSSGNHAALGGLTTNGSGCLGENGDRHLALRVLSSGPLSEGIRDQGVLFFWQVHIEHWLAAQERELLEDPTPQTVTCDFGGGGVGMTLGS